MAHRNALVSATTLYAKKINNGDSGTAAAACNAPDWSVSVTNPSPVRCGLSSKFFNHLFSTCVHLDRCHTCDFIARFCRATLSRDEIASVTRRVAQLLNSRATPLPIKAALYSVQLCRENAVNADWSILVYATKLQCATRRVTLAISSRDKVARQNRAIKSQV